MAQPAKTPRPCTVPPFASAASWTHRDRPARIPSLISRPPADRDPTAARPKPRPIGEGTESNQGGAMIQNPNEIAARQRMEEAMSRIEANVRTRLQMNRRQFICGSAATMALAMLGLAGCSPKADANGNAGAQAYKAGTYEASAEGRNGAVNVKVTFTDDAIDAIDVEHEESRNIGDAAIDILKDKYLQSQSLNFDTVTGASLSSMAFATAVAGVRRPGRRRREGPQEGRHGHRARGRHRRGLRRLHRGFRRRRVCGGRHRGGGRQDGGHAREDGHLRRQHERRRGHAQRARPRASGTPRHRGLGRLLLPANL